MNVKKRISDYCTTILENAEFIKKELEKENANFERYRNNRMFQNGLNMEMLHICEIFNKINHHSSGILCKHNTPFKSITDFRNFITHDYGNFEYGWDVLTIELPKLVSEIESLHKALCQSETPDKPEEQSLRSRMQATSTTKAKQSRIFMLPHEILESKKAGVLEIAKKYEKIGFTNLRVFGSCVYKEDTKDSDIDFLVDVDKTKSLSYFDLCGFSRELQDFLGLNVDLVMSHTLKEHCKDRILKEAKKV